MKNMIQKERKYGIILQSRLNSTPKERLLNEISASLVGKGAGSERTPKILIATPNPEIINQTYSDVVLYSILASADILLVDAVGLLQAGYFLDMGAPYRMSLRIPVCIAQGIYVGGLTFFDRKKIEEKTPLIKGREFFLDLVKLANRRRMKVALVGDGSAVLAAEKLSTGFKKVKLNGYVGPWLNENGMPIDKKEEAVEKKLIAQLNHFKPDILFVGFGAPKQEKWLYNWLPRLDTKLGMCVGRSFEWISGKSKVAPSIFEKLSLEWLWRLVTGSTSVKRIVSALIVFPFRVLGYKIVNR